MELSAVLESNAQRFLETEQPLNAVPLTAMLREVNPTSVKFSLLHATTLLAARDYDQAFRIAADVAKDFEGNMQAVAIAMKSAYELGDVRGCSAYAERLKDSPSMNVVALCYLGRCAELSGDTKRAVHNYCAALDIDPFCGEPMNALIERRLLGVNELRDTIESLRLPPEAEALRASYYARLPGEFVPKEFDKYIPRTTLLLQAARTEYERNDLQQALSLTTSLLKISPFNRECVCLHLSILVDMKATSKLFDVAHLLCSSKPHAELAVYAVGCFHFSLSNYERAGRFFTRATELDASFAEAWIAYGHCYAKLEEGEQALIVYRRAMNFFPGLPCCSTFVGMQYGRAHQWRLASHFLEEAKKAMPNDPLVLNEIGVLYMRTQRVDKAREMLEEAYKSLVNPENASEHRDCIIFNLATVYRKLQCYKQAIAFYTLYVKCRPSASHGHCALAFTHHLMGDMKMAIAHYHTALSIKADSFCRDMLDRALATEFGEASHGFAKRIEESLCSPSPDDISFLAASRTLRSDPTATSSKDHSHHPSVGRSLFFSA
ncbi:cell division cycle protein 16 homolog, putative [Trypanosoma equiperdum]|uniref:Cell division cycle protein 16, putative n=4 Tax=Trypanozoon TaxID=39700 RepID=Q584U1_TRYB2|nr:cell division cycle protein 16, putative [Trypanosoma brucei brucei TREU927]AAX80848.1 cell division cycle protein 16, putative [Trypanosoma brucei]AAZ11777.1 cell division cycle protein 16, putative [Trypanosoma brucei brucei TREU927]RHW72101.1 cell division cycle protein 16 like protein [Trypanosoma brucei equiperdum]SCU72687.1 cell division cycle protein 16 homolog, putative [Trypanosoma equiperdum]